MTSQDKLDLFTSLLLTGTATPERQIAMGNDLVEVCIEFRKMRVTLDAQYQEAREQDEIDRRVKAETALAEHIKASGNIIEMAVWPRPALVRPAVPVVVEMPR